MTRFLLLLLSTLSLSCLADERVFLEAWERTERAFYDKNMQGVDWNAVRDELLPEARNAKTQEETSAVINRALARLGVSHTYHFVPSQREYWELLDVFHPDGVPGRLVRAGVPEGRVRYTGVGLAARAIDGRFFVIDVYDGAPAARAGVLVGDELVAVDGAQWSDVEAFAGRAGRECVLTIRREKDGATRDIRVTPEQLQPRTMFQKSIRQSARVIEKGDRKIAYVRIRSYAHESYQRQLAALLAGRLAACDSLILDLRGGWGGAQAEYMSLFGSNVPDVEFRMRDKDWPPRLPTKVWTKPMAVLIDSDSRSGKEILAHAFKTRRRATLVGTTTRGAVLGGSSFVLSDGSLLMVAVSDVRVDGQSLEGRGVEPDIRVDRPIPYSKGADPQLERAIEHLLE